MTWMALFDNDIVGFSLYIKSICHSIVLITIYITIGSRTFFSDWEKINLRAQNLSLMNVIHFDLLDAHWGINIDLIFIRNNLILQAQLNLCWSNIIGIHAVSLCKKLTYIVLWMKWHHIWWNFVIFVRSKKKKMNEKDTSKRNFCDILF